MPSFYNLFMKPLEKMGIRKARKILIKRAKGRVLEIGAGTGANLPFYNYDNISELVVTDRQRSKHLNEDYHKAVQFVEADAEHLPFPDNSFDVIVHTLVFCSVNDVDQGLQEMKRVLKRDGLLIFIEHVVPDKKRLRSLFHRINPVWKTFSQGCSLTKDFASSLSRNEFQVIRQGRFLNTVFYYGMAIHKDN